MTYITAIELENFQSIETRTRIELKPITLLYGPNSAGKSAIFDAIELLRVLLDPTAIDEQRAERMVDRWARRGSEPTREMVLAVEFPLQLQDEYSVWSEGDNWRGTHKPSEMPSLFILEPEQMEDCGLDPNDLTARIELRFGAKDERGKTLCRLLEASFQVDGRPVLCLSRECPEPRIGSAEPSGDADDPDFSEEDDQDMDWSMFPSVCHWLEICFDTFVSDTSIARAINRFNETLAAEEREKYFYNSGGLRRINAQVDVPMSPLRMATSEYRYRAMFELSEMICRHGEKVVWYFGTMLWHSIRNGAPLVQADRRSPRPEETLTFVDLGLDGWWATSSLSPSSPSALLKGRSPPIDEHFGGLAESAHAALLLKTASHDSWGGGHAKENIESVRSRAEVVERVNHHLESGLFSEKLYRIECASTLMVPIDLDEDDPWSYYALAQPAAVRLFLRDATGHKVDLQDVGSGVSYVLPVLYALSRQGLVQVQQPELHLHPALQASVADVLVEEFHRPRFGQLLIETHSEHLLLRLLKRIRDTEKGKALSDDVKLTNEHLAVYYFDPRPGGGTFVWRQLITPLGDFYNDWPRGFFAERNKDLFDEG
jgi:predicted ATPase